MDPFYWALLLLLLGLVLMILEVFIPSGGVLGVISALAILGAVVIAFTSSMRNGSLVLGLTALGVPLVMYLAVRYWPQTPLGRLILIRLPKSDREILPEHEHGDLKAMIGRIGQAKSKMLPSGLVRIDGRSFDAVSRGMAIDPGETVKVVGVRLNRIVVAPTDEPLPAPLPRSEEEQSEEDLLARPIDALGLDPLDDPLA
ncbi:MAG: NfeD family protein [Pirellulaceae bacterium]